VILSGDAPHGLQLMQLSETVRRTGRPVMTDANLNAWTKLEITGTKGGKPRHVWVANKLVREIRNYANHGRADAVSAGMAIGNADPGTVFVNGAETGAIAGRAMRAQQLSTIFRDAVRAALPSERITITDEGGEREYDRPAVRLYDTRHTFALRLFRRLTAANKDPRDIIQGRLGHKQSGYGYTFSEWLLTLICPIQRVVDAARDQPLSPQSRLTPPQ